MRGLILFAVPENAMRTTAAKISSLSLSMGYVLNHFLNKAHRFDGNLVYDRICPTGKSINGHFEIHSVRDALPLAANSHHGCSKKQWLNNINSSIFKPGPCCHAPDNSEVKNVHPLTRRYSLECRVNYVFLLKNSGHISLLYNGSTHWKGAGCICSLICIIWVTEMFPVSLFLVCFIYNAKRPHSWGFNSVHTCQRDIFCYLQSMFLSTFGVLYLYLYIFGWFFDVFLGQKLDISTRKFQIEVSDSIEKIISRDRPFC